MHSYLDSSTTEISICSGSLIPAIAVPLSLISPGHCSLLFRMDRNALRQVILSILEELTVLGPLTSSLAFCFFSNSIQVSPSVSQVFCGTCS